LLLFILALLVPHAQAELYKWVDEKGKVHYSDQPLTDKTPSIKGSSVGQSEITSTAKKNLDAKNQDYLQRKKDAETAQAKAEADAEKERVQAGNCAKARKHLVTLQNTPRIYSTNATGQRIYMDDAARLTAQSATQKSVAEFCK